MRRRAPWPASSRAAPRFWLLLYRPQVTLSVTGEAAEHLLHRARGARATDWASRLAKGLGGRAALRAQITSGPPRAQYKAFERAAGRPTSGGGSRRACIAAGWGAPQGARPVAKRRPRRTRGAPRAQHCDLLWNRVGAPTNGGERTCERGAGSLLTAQFKLRSMACRVQRRRGPYNLPVYKNAARRRSLLHQLRRAAAGRLTLHVLMLRCVRLEPAASAIPIVEGRNQGCAADRRKGRCGL